MVQVASMTGGPSAYRGGQDTGRRRATAVGVVLALHASLAGVFILAQLRPPPLPPEKTLSVSFITEAAASSAPTPQPPAAPPPPPKAQMMATSGPTPSTMTAAPMERQPERVTPTQPAPPAPPAPPAQAAPSNAPVAAAITPPNFNAAYLKNPPAIYPPASRYRHEQGVVRLRVQVSAEGAPTQVLLERSSGFPALDAAALDVVKKRYKFSPAKQGDRAVSAWVIVPMEFSL